MHSGVNMKYQVTIEPLGEAIEVAAGQTILDAALRSGLYLPHACSHGICSACKVQVTEGEVDVGNVSEFALLDSERDENRCLACCATPLTNLVIEADIEIDPDAERHPVLDYQATVISTRNLSAGIKSIFLALGDDGINFQAGQYINVHLPGLEGQRAFSIASPPSSHNVVELNVAQVEGGEGTRYLHNNLHVGDTVSFSGPYGQFYLRKSRPEPIIFLAGGSGLSGVKSMVMELIENNDQRPITLIFGARSLRDAYYQELFKQYELNHPNFNFHLAISDGTPQSGEDAAWGCVHDVARDIFQGNFEGHNAYICGPPAMVDACVSTLIRGRCFERHLYVEKFYNSSSRNLKTKSPIFRGV